MFGPGPPEPDFRHVGVTLDHFFSIKDPYPLQYRFQYRFLIDFVPIWGAPLDPKILQNYVRGVRNQTLRMYTLDVDPMSFRTDQP